MTTATNKLYDENAMIRIMAFPRRGDSYTACFYDALESLGVEVQEGIFAGRWLIRHLYNVDFVHMHWPSFFYAYPRRLMCLRAYVLFLFFLLLARWRGARILWTAHNLYPHDRCVIPFLDVLTRWLLIRVAARFFLHGPAAEAQFLVEFPRAKGRTAIIDHGHWIGYYPDTIDRATARAKLGLDQSDFVFLFFGSARRYKNIEALIEAFRGMPPQALLLVVGKFREPDYEAAIRYAIEKSGARITLRPNFVPDDEVQIYLRACDVVVAPYRDILTSGTALLSLSFGRPLVAPALGALKDIVGAACGRLYDPLDPTSLARALLAIMPVRFDEARIIEQVRKYDWTAAAQRFVLELQPLTRHAGKASPDGATAATTSLKDWLAKIPGPVSPLFADIGVLAMPYHQFGSIWMTPHHLLTRLASYFEVVWMEPPHHWRELRNVKSRGHTIEEFVRDLPASFHVYLPDIWLPDVYSSSWLRRLLLRARVWRGWQLLGRRRCERFVLYLWHHQFEASVAGRRQDLSIYHIEDEYSFEPEPPPMSARELRLIREVDQVFVHSPQLMERKGWINPHTTFVPNGVDYALYSTPVAEPPDIAAIPHPRIGYTGHLKRQLDWSLLFELSKRHPDWSFVLVGACNLPANERARFDEMSRLPNVYVLGRKTVTELAAYPQHFDVCIMPYIVNGYTQNIYPLKLHEYLACGRPVVGAPIRSLIDFSHVIELASTVDEWSEALARALHPPANSREARQARQETARQNDWDELVYRIAQVICTHLGTEYLTALRKLKTETPELTDTNPVA